MIKINWKQAIGRILIAVGIVGGVESTVIGGSTGRGVAVVSMILIIVGAITMECKHSKKKR